jgi:ATP-dependent RNA helicase DDX5/DBP2
MQSYGGYGNGGSYGGGGWGHHDDKMSHLGGSLRAVDWASTRLERFEKNFYAEEERVSSRSDREIEEFRRAKEIKVPFFPSYNTRPQTVFSGARARRATTNNII